MTVEPAEKRSEDGAKIVFCYTCVLSLDIFLFYDFSSLPALCLRKSFFGSCFPLRLGRPVGRERKPVAAKEEKKATGIFPSPFCFRSLRLLQSAKPAARSLRLVRKKEDRLMFVELSTCKQDIIAVFSFDRLQWQKLTKCLIFVTTTTTTSSSSSSSSSSRRRRSNNNNRSSSCCSSRSNNNRSSSNNNSRCNKSTRRKTKVYELQIVTCKVQKIILFLFEV